MKSVVTSYDGLFARRSDDGPAIERIEIPLIQRDYAQGRAGDAVARIRGGFLGALRGAVTGGEPLSLDFVYGDVETGTLRPLDGQQRLTTLFLLHWYLASRADRIDSATGWKRFSYATRPSARRFCERLVEHAAPPDLEQPSAWIEDQPWYLFTWHHDPTVQSMLVMLDAMHHCFRKDDCAAAWERLVDPGRPAISFHLLPIEEMGSSEDLYIKMNSRGKPLTPFETFKARFEQILQRSCPGRVDELARKIDGEWTDLVWKYDDGDCVIDDELLRYIDFVTELCEWRDGRGDPDLLAARAERTFGPENPRAAAHLELFFHAFDTWRDTDVPQAFADLFATAPAPLESEDTRRVVLFDPLASRGVDLFAACCRTYKRAERNRPFNLSQSLLLYAVLVSRQHTTLDTDPTGRRLRVLRNLLEASSNELRLERMPALLAEVERVMMDGTLDAVVTFNQAQVADERAKAELLHASPELEHTLFPLEDHPVLRGSLTAFDLDAEVLPRRAAAFHRLFADKGVWPALTGALLATGDYARPLDSRYVQLGSGSSATCWRALLTGATRAKLERTREVLGRLLDRIALTEGPTVEVLEAIQEEWLTKCEAAQMLDWRYYFVKYPVMREGASGVYVGSEGSLGYRVCMLHKRYLNSNYRDPYLLAMKRESEVGDAVVDPWFTGYETQPRWMRLVKSGVAFRCVDEGIALQPPTRDADRAVFDRVCADHGVGDARVLTIPQAMHDGRAVDQLDRVIRGAALLSDLVGAGL